MHSITCRLFFIRLIHLNFLGTRPQSRGINRLSPGVYVPSRHFVTEDSHGIGTPASRGLSPNRLSSLLALSAFQRQNQIPLQNDDRINLSRSRPHLFCPHRLLVSSTEPVQLFGPDGHVWLHNVSWSTIETPCIVQNHFDYLGAAYTYGFATYLGSRLRLHDRPQAKPLECSRVHPPTDIAIDAAVEGAVAAAMTSSVRMYVFV